MGRGFPYQLNDEFPQIGLQALDAASLAQLAAFARVTEQVKSTLGPHHPELQLLPKLAGTLPDLDSLRASIEKAVDGESGFDTEFRVVRPDGQHRFVRCRGEIARDHRGQGETVIGTLLDFTERKQTEISLKQSRQTLRELAQHLQSVREEERSNISRQIHDELGQSLAAMKIDIVRLRSRLGADRGGSLRDRVVLALDGDRPAALGPGVGVEVRGQHPLGDMRVIPKQRLARRERLGPLLELLESCQVQLVTIDD